MTDDHGVSPQIYMISQRLCWSLRVALCCADSLVWCEHYTVVFISISICQAHLFQFSKVVVVGIMSYGAYRVENWKPSLKCYMLHISFQYRNCTELYFTKKHILWTAVRYSNCQPAEFFGDVQTCRNKSIRTLGRIMKFGRQRRHSSDLPAVSPRFVDAADNLGMHFIAFLAATAHHLIYTVFEKSSPFCLSQ